MFTRLNVLLCEVKNLHTSLLYSLLITFLFLPLFSLILKIMSGVGGGVLGNETIL